ncbi:MAG: Pilus assembly protein [Alphaproteobacteria bacterium]|nr:Pilus assembly protein [Alphaproteobacteria bacterium]
MRIISNLIRDERAATAVEYGLILAMIVLAMIGALTMLASSTTTMWNNVSSTVSGVM